MAGRLTRYAGLTVLMLAAALFGVALAAHSPAFAHDRATPKTALMKSKQELQGGLNVGEHSWNYPAGDGLCANKTVVYRYRFPEASGVAPGDDLRVRIANAHRPDGFSLAAYRGVDKDSLPTGKARVLRRTLEPVFRDGERVAWDAVFSADQPGRHYYLVAEGHWQDREGCGGDQYAFWSFHVTTRGS